MDLQTPRKQGRRFRVIVVCLFVNGYEILLQLIQSFTKN